MTKTGPHPFMGEHPLSTTGCFMGCGKDKADPIHGGYDKLGRPHPCEKIACGNRADIPIFAPLTLKHAFSCKEHIEGLEAIGWERGSGWPYDRATLVHILVYHYRVAGKGCGCGWEQLGASWPEHVADAYEERMRLGR